MSRNTRKLSDHWKMRDFEFSTNKHGVGIGEIKKGVLKKSIRRSVLSKLEPIIRFGLNYICGIVSMDTI